MPIFDASGFADDLAGWRAQLGARIQDLLARKSLAGAGRLGAIVRKIETAVSTATLKGAVSDLLAYFRKEAPLANGDECDLELERYFAQIRAHGRKESIENYSSFIFTVDLAL